MRTLPVARLQLLEAYLKPFAELRHQQQRHPKHLRGHGLVAQQPEQRGEPAQFF